MAGTTGMMRAVGEEGQREGWDRVDDMGLVNKGLGFNFKSYEEPLGDFKQGRDMI